MLLNKLATTNVPGQGQECCLLVDGNRYSPNLCWGHADHRRDVLYRVDQLGTSHQLGMATPWGAAAAVANTGCLLM
jgi:hypothetical protein